MSVDSEVYNDWCLPHIYDDCSPTSNPRGSNLLFGCVSAVTVLKNAFVLVQVNRFQQIIGVYTLQAPSYGNKVDRSDLHYRTTLSHIGAWPWRSSLSTCLLSDNLLLMAKRPVGQWHSGIKHSHQLTSVSWLRLTVLSKHAWSIVKKSAIKTYRVLHTVFTDRQIDGQNSTFSDR